MASAEEYKWLIELVQGRYAALGLSFEQAERIHEYEAVRDIYSEKHYFSNWEEWDFELASFRQILDAAQMKVYETSLLESIQRFEVSLAEQDERHHTEIAFQEAVVRFYETQLLPDLLNPTFPLFFSLRQDASKVDFLRKEYQSFLREAKKEMLVNHFRHNRTFSPAALQAALLRHKLWSLLPDYHMFKHHMDAPTKAVAEFVEQKVMIMLDQTRQLIKRKFAELKEFSDAHYRQHYGESKGWHIVHAKEDEAAEMMRCAMSVLLLEQKEGAE